MDLYIQASMIPAQQIDTIENCAGKVTVIAVAIG
jgi:hypothetical protein